MAHSDYENTPRFTNLRCRQTYLKDIHILYRTERLSTFVDVAAEPVQGEHPDW